MTRSVESLSRGAGAMSLPYEWSRSANVRFVGEPPYPNASHVTVKEIGMPSGSYRGDYVTVSKLCPAEMRTFTIVQVDVDAGLSEEEEESPGLFLCLSNVVPVTLSIRPANLPSDQLLTLTGVENCYEDPEKHTPAASSYPVSRFPLTLYLEGQSPGSGSITATHSASGAKDRIGYSVAALHLRLSDTSPCKGSVVNADLALEGPWLSDFDVLWNVEAEWSSPSPWAVPVLLGYAIGDDGCPVNIGMTPQGGPIVVGLWPEVEGEIVTITALAEPAGCSASAALGIRCHDCRDACASWKVTYDTLHEIGTNLVAKSEQIAKTQQRIKALRLYLAGLLAIKIGDVCGPPGTAEENAAACVGMITEKALEIFGDSPMDETVDTALRHLEEVFATYTA